MILISFKIVVVFNTTSADFVLMSADVVLKTTTILKDYITCIESKISFYSKATNMDVLEEKSEFNSVCKQYEIKVGGGVGDMSATE